MRIDSHQHFWKYDEAEYPWIGKGSPLHRNWLPADLAALQRPLEIDGSVAVQARQTVEESRWLLSLADANPSIRAVVGWVDLRAENVEEQIAPLALHPKFRGVRHVVQSEPDDSFMLQPAFIRGIKSLHQFGFTYDLLVFPKQLPAAIKLVSKFPHQPFVLDHVAKPSIRDGVVSPWRESLQQLAKAPNVYCKASGLLTEAHHEKWKAEDFRPYLDVVFEAFGPDRIMWGSDWPVCLLAGSYRQSYELIQEYVRVLPAQAQAAIFGGNAVKFYRIQ